MKRMARPVLIAIAVCAASGKPAAADPIADYCALLIDRLHFCMHAFFGPEKSDAAKDECIRAPALVEGKFKDALASLPTDSPRRTTLAQSYFALALDVDVFPTVTMNRTLTDEELNRLQPIVHKACDPE